MKLATPITLTFTDQRVDGMPQLDLQAGYIRIPVALTTADGLTIRRDVVLDRPTERTVLEEVEEELEVDGATNPRTGRPEKVKIKQRTQKAVKVRAAQCQRVAVNPTATSADGLLKVEQFENFEAFENARQAMKADDEIAALEAAGVADGWLLPTK